MEFHKILHGIRFSPDTRFDVSQFYLNKSNINRRKIHAIRRISMIAICHKIWYIEIKKKKKIKRCLMMQNLSMISRHERMDHYLCKSNIYLTLIKFNKSIVVITMGKDTS